MRCHPAPPVPRPAATLTGRAGSGFLGGSGVAALGPLFASGNHRGAGEQERQDGRGGHLQGPTLAPVRGWGRRECTSLVHRCTNGVHQCTIPVHQPTLPSRRALHAIGNFHQLLRVLTQRGTFLAYVYSRSLAAPEASPRSRRYPIVPLASRWSPAADHLPQAPPCRQTRQPSGLRSRRAGLRQKAGFRSPGAPSWLQSSGLLGP